MFEPDTHVTEDTSGQPLRHHVISVTQGARPQNRRAARRIVLLPIHYVCSPPGSISRSSLAPPQHLGILSRDVCVHVRRAVNHTHDCCCSLWIFPLFSSSNGTKSTTAWFKNRYFEMQIWRVSITQHVDLNN